MQVTFMKSRKVGNDRKIFYKRDFEIEDSIAVWNLIYNHFYTGEFEIEEIDISLGFRLFTIETNKGYRCEWLCCED